METEEEGKRKKEGVTRAKHTKTLSKIKIIKQTQSQ
jgi:hypothetical protein